MSHLLSTLKQYFGFTSFRPLQEEIIRDSLRGHDIFALLPTGGGKSLCFQLPALLKPGLTLVISPLISLMKNQVDAMQASGVAATFLNSSINAHDSRTRLQGLDQGEYRLLYLAPERVMLSGMLERLPRWKIGLIAIDEVHCISEWGHDFRPEYRQLPQLREYLPKVPLMALTATATERVRKDILHHLRLQRPRIYVASFNRSNLIYRVIGKKRAYHQILNFLRQHHQESGIIYCQSRKTTEMLAEKLSRDRIKAKPYHAGLTPEERSRHQELFLRDEIDVICATIAFGMGIDKSNVRFVIHHDLPKNIEGYYQETGRAGRDGLPSECLLLFSPGDAIKYSKFIEEKPDLNEQEISRAQLQQIIRYAELTSCRRTELLRYFGEDFNAKDCGACDNCLSPRATFDGTIVAQKFLSCVYRIREKSGFSVGLNHVANVLIGAKTEKTKRWQHEQLSTYGVGKEYGNAEWKAIGRELIRLGLVHQTPEKFSSLKLTLEGLAVLKQRKPVTLTRIMVESGKKITLPRELTYDEILFERLRRLRKKLADDHNVPAYIIFSDATLKQMAYSTPKNKDDFSKLGGVGEKKLREFGEIFLEEIGQHLSV